MLSGTSMHFIQSILMNNCLLSDRTLSHFRTRVLSYETKHDVDLIHECVVKLTKEISMFLKITPNMQRIDSLMVAVNIKNLSLLEFFYTFVANLAKIQAIRILHSVIKQLAKIWNKIETCSACPYKDKKPATFP